MKDNADKRNLEKYKIEISNLTDRELLEEKAYFTFASYRVLERIYTLMSIFAILFLIGIAVSFFRVFIGKV